MTDVNENPTAEEDTPAFEKESYMDSGRKTDSTEHFAGAVTSLDHSSHVPNGCILTCDNLVKLSIKALDEHVIHLNYAPDGHLGDGFSYAALPERYPADQSLQVTESPEAIQLTTDALSIEITRKGLQLSIANREGQILSKDEKGSVSYTHLTLPTKA